MLVEKTVYVGMLISCRSEKLGLSFGPWSLGLLANPAKSKHHSLVTFLQRVRQDRSVRGIV